MDENANRDTVTSSLYRDPAVSILFGVALLLIVLNLAAAALFAFKGHAYIELIKAGLLLTGIFAVVGMALGLVRGLRSGRAIKRWGA